MNENDLRPDLLRLVCAALPPEEAFALGTGDPLDPDTYAAAYAAVLRTGTVLPPELDRLFGAMLATPASLSEAVR